MEPNHKVQINGDWEIASYERRAGKSLYFHKTLLDGKQGPDHVVNGSEWLVWNFLEVNCDLVLGHSQHSLRAYAGLRVYTPPFSIVAYDKGPGSFTVEAFGTPTPTEMDLGENILAMTGPMGPLPVTIKDLIPHAKSLSVIQKLEPAATSLARRCRQKISETFRQNISLSEIADALKSSNGVLSRQFKASYSISPSIYRQRLRVVDALGQMFLNDRNVEQASQFVGYQSRSKFNQVFQQTFLAEPSRYLT